MKLRLPEEGMKDFWEVCHENTSSRYLGAFCRRAYEAFLKIKTNIQEANTILEIGVGEGIATREMAVGEKEIHVLDIAKTALERVKDIATGWQLSEIDQLPKNYFDLAISHLVAQHINDDALMLHLSHVIPSLKEAGVFALQFSIALEDDQPVTEICMREGLVTRSESVVAEMVQKAGGEIIKTVPQKTWPKWGLVWNGMHIIRSRK